MKIIAYVDGFNLYYGALKGKPYRWLDLTALVRRYAHRAQDVSVKYFTARVSAKVKESSPVTQELYLKALKETQVEVYEGNFVVREKAMPRADGGGLVQVSVYEEKGSDVNLASHLLFDACHHRFDSAVVITNDTDLVTPIRMCVADLKRKVYLLSPRKAVAQSLRAAASGTWELKTAALRATQFPFSLDSPRGKITKPEKWVAQDIVFSALEIMQSGQRQAAIEMLKSLTDQQSDRLFDAKHQVQLRRCILDKLEPQEIDTIIKDLAQAATRA